MGKDRGRARPAAPDESKPVHPLGDRAPISSRACEAVVTDQVLMSPVFKREVVPPVPKAATRVVHATPPGPPSQDSTATGTSSPAEAAEALRGL